MRANAAASDGSHAVRLRHVAKAFRARRRTVQAVVDVDVTIAQGERVALLGPNGAGKSTTLDMLLGLARPDHGSVSVLGRPPRHAVRSGRVGAMLQSGALRRDVSPRELVGMVAALHGASPTVPAVLRQAGVEAIADRRTQKLSGGEAQRVRLALALVSDPELLVLDEPTVGLDVPTRRRFWGTVNEAAAGGRTVLFATHHLEEADEHADRAVVLLDGRVVADGPTAELRAAIGRRTLRATVDDEDDDLERLPGVMQVERRGSAVALTCSDSDAALRALLSARPDARDIEVTSIGIEEAFVELTAPREPEEVA